MKQKLSDKGTHKSCCGNIECKSKDKNKSKGRCETLVEHQDCQPLSYLAQKYDLEWDPFPSTTID